MFSIQSCRQFSYEDIINLNATFVISIREVDEHNLTSFEIYRQLTSETKSYKNEEKGEMAVCCLCFLL